MLRVVESATNGAKLCMYAVAEDAGMLNPLLELPPFVGALTNSGHAAPSWSAAAGDAASHGHHGERA